MSVLTLPLTIEKWQADRLNRKYETARKIYNSVLKKELTKLQELKKTKKWRHNETIIVEEYKKIDREKAKQNADLKTALQERNKMLQDEGFTQFSFISETQKFAEHFSASIPSNMAAETIAKPLWSAFESVLYRKGKNLHFKRYEEFNSIATNGKSGLRLIEEDGKYYILFSNIRKRAKPIKMYINGPSNEYEDNMIKRKIKIIRIIRKMEKTKFHYYVQLVVEGAPYQKNKNGILIHPIIPGTVGLAVWRTKLCAVSQNGYKSWELCPDLEEYSLKRDLLNKEMEEVRRCNNPDNYNEDGTIKKGIIIDGKRQKLCWHDSNRYKDLKREKRELERKNRETRKIYQNKIVNELLTMGDHFIMPEVSFITKKAKFDEDNRLTNVEYKKKKDRRKSIQEGAPAALIARLNQRLAFAEKEDVIRIKLSEEMYWYHHSINASAKHLYQGDKVIIGTDLYDHTLYRAFLAYNFNEEIKTFDVEKINRSLHLLSDKL